MRPVALRETNGQKGTDIMQKQKAMKLYMPLHQQNCY